MHDFQRMEQCSYKYMMDRMKRDLISLTLTINDLTESLRSKQMIYETENKNECKTSEQKLQADMRLNLLYNQLERDQKKRQERIGSLNLSIKNKELAIQKRTERRQNQQRIREQAANESKDQKEVENQCKFRFQKMWGWFMKRKMERVMKQHASNEQAFMRMR